MSADIDEWETVGLRSHSTDAHQKLELDVGVLIVGECEKILGLNLHQPTPDHPHCLSICCCPVSAARRLLET